MHAPTLIQGRRIGAEDLREIRTLLREHPTWHRTLISRELSRRWGWRNEVGQLKDMACRTLLLKLETRGLITLPARQRASVNGARNRKPAEVAHDQTPLRAGLETLQPFEVKSLGTGSPQAQLFQWLMGA